MNKLRLSIFNLFIISLPFCNIIFIPNAFVRPLFTILALPFFILYLININSLVKFELKFIILSLFSIIYSLLLCFFSNTFEFSLLSFSQYSIFVLNFLTLSFLFRDFNITKMRSFFIYSVIMSFINSTIIFLQSQSLSAPNFINRFIVNNVNSISGSPFLYKPNGLFPESSLAAIYSLFTSLPILESCIYYYFLRSYSDKSGREILTLSLRILCLISLLVSIYSGSRTLILGILLLLIARYTLPLIKFTGKVSNLFYKTIVFLVFLYLFNSYIFPFIGSLFSLDESIYKGITSNITRTALLVASFNALVSHPFGLGLGVFKSTYSSYLPDWAIYSNEINVALGASSELYGIDSSLFTIDAKSLLGLLSLDFGLPIFFLIVFFTIKLFITIGGISKVYESSGNYTFVFYIRYIQNLFILLPIVSLTTSSIVLPFLPLPYVLSLLLIRNSTSIK